MCRLALVSWPKLAATICFAAVFTCRAPADREHTTPTDWWWMSNATEAQVNARADQGFRLFDVEHSITTPNRFMGVFVANSGIYGKDWWWRINRTEAQLESFMAGNNARLLDLEVTRVNGQPRLTATLIRNTGDDAVGWWYYYDKSFQYIVDRVNEHNARVIDLDTYVVNGTRYWSAVMVHNVGDFYQNWWWYPSLDSSEINDKLAIHNGRLVDIERRSDGRFAVVMVESHGEFWRYWPNLTYQQLVDRYDQRKTRLIDLEAYFVNGQRRFAAIMLDNANSVERRLRGFMLGQTDGPYGFYLKRMGGPVLAETFGDRPFYPSSTIKIIEHVYSMRQVQLGLGNPSIFRFPNSTLDVHVTPPFPPSEALSIAQTLMMVNSDNNRTNYIQDYFGRIPLGNNITAWFGTLGRSLMNDYMHNTVGLSDDTNLNHKLGGGGPDSYDPANSCTLQDLGLLYERLMAGELMNQSTVNTLLSRMLYTGGPNNSHSLFTAITSVVNQEAALLGITGSSLNSFRSAMLVAFKAGSLNVSLSYASNAGWISLPVLNRGGSITSRQYVFGTFADGYTFANFGLSSSTNPQIVGEMLRDEIRSALETFAP